ncbi:hypothetical protein ABW19_dt0206143 [Dactylella cylindrospora]|nr:hypothetical protein ABW19_dt0206143 [Dactylella cylindrospora]
MPIQSLPLELLRQILTDKGFSNKDLRSISLVCNAFYSVASTAQRHPHTITVDSKDHSVYRLARCMLLNPSVGDSFDELRIDWERRYEDGEEDWPRRWKWTDEEKAKIRSLGEEYGFEKEMVNTIIDGMNSEPVLLVIFCLTRNMTTLDVGGVDGGMSGGRGALSYHGRMWRKRERKLEAEEAEGGEEGEGGESEEDEEDEEEEEEETVEDEDDDDDDRQVWFEEYLEGLLKKEGEKPSSERDPKNIKWPAGLLKLQHYHRQHYDTEGGWSATPLAPILFLPNITTLQAVFPQYGFEGLLDLFPNFKSSLKKLTFYGSQLHIEEYKSLAKRCGNLTKVDIDIEPGYDMIDVDVLQTARGFLRANRGSLRKENLSIDYSCDSEHYVDGKFNGAEDTEMYSDDEDE